MIRAGVTSDVLALDTGIPIQVHLTISLSWYKRYLISVPFVPEHEVTPRARRKDHRRIPFVKPIADEADKRKMRAAEAAAWAAQKDKPMKAEDAVLQQMAADEM